MNAPNLHTLKNPKSDVVLLNFFGIEYPINRAVAATTVLDVFVCDFIQSNARIDERGDWALCLGKDDYEAFLFAISEASDRAKEVRAKFNDIHKATMKAG